MFLQRAAVTLIMGPLALYIIYLGGWFYFLPITAVLLLAATEYTNLLQHSGRRMSNLILLPLVLLLLIVAQWYGPVFFTFTFFIALLVVLIYALWLYERGHSPNATADWMAMTGGVVLLGWLGSHFLALRGIEQMAWQWTMLAMLSAWITDAAAYVVGHFLAGNVLGRHRLAPRLSPNKTVEGYLGGIVLATAVILPVANLLQLSLSASLLLVLLISSLSVFGDLGMSLLKREAGFKDSGVLFPGHGGALDRIDSLVWAVALAYYLSLFLDLA
ncbi:MAG: phosphatidate cytidylyltransferase [Chloroflexota bacterium]